jgi:EAL domain-containing protein (putative c-di-GMP-specific phosphodiesterase class I)
MAIKIIRAEKYQAIEQRYLFLVELHGLLCLDDLISRQVMDKLLDEWKRRLPDVMNALLRPNEEAGSIQILQRGRWGSVLTICDGNLAEDNPLDWLRAFRSEAQHLINGLAMEIFGTATAATADAVADLTGLSEGVYDLAAWTNTRLSAKAPRTEGLSELCDELDFIIGSGGIRTILQPIVSFPDGDVVGVEALSRGPAGSTLESAKSLFNAGRRTGKTDTLEWACALRALEWIDHLPRFLWLSINAGISLLGNAEVRSRLARPGLVVEITEHQPIRHTDEVREIIKELRAGGARIALDDTGCGFADAETVKFLRPDIVKICMTVISDDSYNEHILGEIAEEIAQMESLNSGARTEILAEGVETRAQAETLRSLGIDLAQGWLYGKPFPAEDWPLYLG